MPRRFDNIADTVRFHRIKMGLSQTDLSKVLNYKNGQYISNVERGLCSLPARTLHKLSAALRVSTEDLVEKMVLDFRENLKREADQAGM